jgi:hypothetical protein
MFVEKLKIFCLAAVVSACVIYTLPIICLTTVFSHIELHQSCFFTNRIASKLVKHLFTLLVDFYLFRNRFCYTLPSSCLTAVSLHIVLHKKLFNKTTVFSA